MTPYQTYQLDLRKYGRQTALSQEVLETAAATSELDAETGMVFVRMSVKLLTSRLLSSRVSRVVTVPANPWQHLKQRFAPSWFLARWPVEYEELTIHFDLDVDALYPKAQIPIQRDRMLIPVFHEEARWVVDHEAETPAAVAPAPELTYGRTREEADRMWLFAGGSGRV